MSLQLETVCSLTESTSDLSLQRVSHCDTNIQDTVKDQSPSGKIENVSVPPPEVKLPDQQGSELTRDLRCKFSKLFVRRLC
jgi:hypothetical protein